jgi:hypothetical protein
MGGMILVSSDFRNAVVAANRSSIFCSGSVNIEAKNTFAASATSYGVLYDTRATPQPPELACG